MIIDKLILLEICLFLPISLYFNYSTYKKTLELKENTLMFEFTLISSLLLMIKYDISPDIYSLFIYVIPLILALIKKKIILFFSLLTILVSLTTITIPDNIDIISLIFSIATLIASVYFIIYFFKINNIVIELSNIRKELEREKLLRSSISKLTHELKNPIAVCNGYLEMFDLSNKEKSEKYLKIITDEIIRSKVIIDEFSSYGKLKKITKEEIDITYLLENIIDLLKPLFKQHKASICMNETADIYIKGDYNKLKQVIINLLKNSLEAKKEEETLTVNIKLRQTKKQVIINIIDNGVGMDKETLSKVTDVFFTTKQNGTGIGLAFSKEVINLHKGTFKINSKLNEGTKITISLPKEKKSEDFNKRNY